MVMLSRGKEEIVDRKLSADKVISEIIFYLWIYPVKLEFCIEAL